MQVFYLFVICPICVQNGYVYTYTEFSYVYGAAPYTVCI